MKVTTVSERALVVAPRGRDATVAVDMLREAGIEAFACSSLLALIDELYRGAALAIVTEEAIATADLYALSQWIEAQEEWSDLPFILLTNRGGGLERNPVAGRHLDVLGNVTFLERPFHPTTLVSLARSALRGRRRQYEARARLIDLRHSAERLRFMGRLDETLRASPDARTVMSSAAELLARRLEASRCAYADVDPDNDQFIIRDDYRAPGIPSSAGTYSLDLFGPRAAADMRDGKTLIVHDVGSELAAGEGQEMFQSIHVNAIVCCPLVKDGRLVAMMAVHQDEPRDWSGDDIALTEFTAGRCWSHVARVSAEARLRESEAKFQAIANSIDQMVWSTRPDGFHDYYNQRWYDYTGVPPGSTDGEAWNGMFHPDDQERAWATWKQCLRTGEPYEIEYRLRHRSGEYRWVLGRAQCMRDDDGRIVRWFGTCTDIQEIVEARDILARSREALEAEVSRRTDELVQAQEALRQSQKLEAMGQLTGGVAHDFNNLLTPIVGSLDLLQRKSVGTEREQRLIDGALQSAERAKTLVQRLLAFARRQPLQASAVDIGQLVEGMAELLSSTTGPQVRVVVDIAPDLPPANADPNQLEMALLNLGVNARDAMSEGGVLRISATVATVARPTGDLKPGQFVRLSVADTGSGMDETTLARAIEPFFSTKGVGKGTGLGLSMAHGLAAQLGGALKIQSRLGVGTNVELWLPVTHVEPAPVLPQAERLELDAHSGLVLLVDDEAIVRASTVDMLTDLGYRVVEAESAEVALQHVNRGTRPDLVVTDHLMPGMSGVDLVRAIRGRYRDLPALVVSGYADAEDIAPDLPRLTKPFRRHELAAKLRELAM